jgi:hypothetical protein
MEPAPHRPESNPAPARRPSRLFRERAVPCCDHCAFPLTGLADEGACPECGVPYDAASSRRLHAPPKAWRAALHLLLPILVGTAATFATGWVASTIVQGNAQDILGATAATGAVASAFAIWFGLRLYCAGRDFYDEVLPGRVSQTVRMQALAIGGAAFAGLVSALASVALLASLTLGMVVLFGP